MLAVAVLVTLAGLANLLGTYMIKPVVNAVGEGDQAAFARGVALAAAVYVVGVASAAATLQLHGARAAPLRSPRRFAATSSRTSSACRSRSSTVLATAT